MRPQHVRDGERIDMTFMALPHSGRRRQSGRWLTHVPVIAACLFLARVASAQTTFGTLSNFDVFNDTGQESHGFEIELDGVSSGDVSFTFGSH